ncbi:MAG: class II aldolase/adducin family protein [Lachnospiraceae bacterium]|nr:class II aldolase/adducin family protein [Lachnospiraceae bacterium]
MESHMQGFIRISKYAGMRNDLGQAGGGNTSVKLDDQVMLVKSSGFQLADVSENSGYSKIDYRLIEEYFKENIRADGKFVLTEDAGNALLVKAQMAGGRASIETFLHAVTGKYTLHSHPTLVNILTARKDGREILEELFPDAVYVPYRKPGAALAETYYKICQAAGEPEIIFLESHGLVVSGGLAERVISRTEEVLEKIAAYLQVSYEAYPNATKLWDAFAGIPELAERIVYLSENRFLSPGTAEGDILQAEKWNHAFCPDCVVYGSKKPLFLADDFGAADVTAFIERSGIPAMVCYKGRVYILAESVKKAQEIENVMSFAAQVQAANRSHEMQFLSEGQQDALLNWDAEKYRRKL